MGDLLNPDCPIAKAFREECVREAEQIERIRKMRAEREASRARWNAMTREERMEAMYDGDESEWEG